MPASSQRQSHTGAAGRRYSSRTGNAGRFLILSLVLAANCHGDRHLSGGAVDALLAERVTAGRMAAQREWRPCGTDRRDGPVPRSRCGGDPVRGSPGFHRLVEATDRARWAAGRDGATQKDRMFALLDLQWHGLSPGGLDRAVAALDQARRIAPDDPDLLNDLAVALVAVAERDQALSPMLRALELVEHALERDPAHLPALFNRALVLDRLHLAASAGRAWDAYLEREPDPQWRTEAQARRRDVAEATRLPHAPDLEQWIADGARVDALAPLVRRSPERARELGFRLLEQWGSAVRGGDAARADSLLAAGARLARAGSGSEGGDAVASAVAQAAVVAGRLRLAEGYTALGEGVRLFSDGHFAQALAPLERAGRRLRVRRSPLAGWATFYRAASLVSLGRYDEGDALFREIVPGAAPGESALAAKALLGLGVSQLRRGDYESAGELYARAAPYVARAREPELAGYAAYLRAEALALSGQDVAARAEAYHGLLLLAPFRRSNYLNNHLARVAGMARGAGLSRAALAVMDEVLDVAGRLEKPEVLALALCARARDLSAAGRAAQADADLRAAEAWAARMPPGRGHERIRAAVLLTRGELVGRSDPARALPLLEEAVERFRHFENDPYLPAALYEAARVAGLGERRERSLAWLREAVRTTERQQATFRATASRATFAETVEKTSDLMVAAQLSAGRPDSAFAYMERARAAAFAPGLTPRGRALGPDAVRERLPADMLLVAYALLEDRMVVWGISRERWRTYVVLVPRDSLRRLVERSSREVAASVPDSAVALAGLHELLLGPLHRELSRARRVVVVPDRELHAVPFPALRDRGAGRYAVESHEFRTVPSASFLLRAIANGPRRRTAPRALVAGNPALAGAATERFDPLPGSEREATAVARLHPGSTLLLGGEVERERVVAHLSGASLFHFAGHAVFDGDRPERSYLVLASRGAEEGRLTAAEISGLRLSNLEVVVLSACSTRNPRPTRAGGAAGLAFSFMSAGAPATVSTLWDVSDAHSAELLVAFHREMRTGRPPAQSLREAQLQALRSPHAAVRAPRTWAAFTYTGA